MDISPEIISQSVFIAALFLTLISVPKLIVLTVWYTYRILLFRNLERVVRGKSFQAIIKGDALQSLTKMSEDPMFRLKQTAREYGNFVKNIRDPVIEASTALIIMLPIYLTYPEILKWLIISLIVIVTIIVWALVLVFLFAKDINKIAVRNECGASEIEPNQHEKK